MYIRLLIALAIPLALLCQPAPPVAEIHGHVVDVSTNEPLARVGIQMSSGAIIQKGITDNDGAFRIANLAPGDYVLHVETVGYYLLRQDLTLAAGESRELNVVLSPSSNRRKESVEVTAKPFEAERQESPAQLTLTGTEMKNLASVLTDDPLRAVQGMPGVVSDNDFNSQFSVRGADFSRIGVYLDGILLHEPFHMVEGQGSYGSMTAFSGDIVDAVSLYEGAWPPRYSDRTAGILSMDTRDGSSKQFIFRVSASMTDTSVLAEGPLGHSKRISWYATFRKSYLQYLLDHLNTNFPNLVFGFTDAQGKLTFQATPKHTLTLSFLEADSGLDRSAIKSQLGVGSLMLSNYDLTSLNLGSRYAPTQSFLVTSHVAWMRERGSSSNPTGVSLGNDGYAEWVGRSDATWIEGSAGTMYFGGFVRRLRDDGYDAEYQSSGLVELDRYRGAAVRSGGYAQQSWNLRNRVQFNVGVRYDRTTVITVPVVSPFASLTIEPFSATRVQLAWGQYAQFPELAQSFSIFGSTRLLPERSTHLEAALEQSLGDKTRVRAEFYDRQDRDLMDRPLFDPRLLANGTVFFAPNTAPWTNSQRGYGRGAQVMIQRRTANGFTGWVSYAYGVAKVDDGVLHLTFPTDNDQRHTVNVFGSYRLRPTVNLSMKWLYGSGLPIPGFYRLVNGQYYLAMNRNQLRLPDYQRVDVRMNKEWAHDKWKTKLFAEVVNLFNHTNERFDSFNGYNGKTGQASPSFFNMFPILPSVGVVFER